MGKARGVVVGCVLVAGIAASVASSSEEATPVDDDEAATDDGPTGETASTFAVGDTVELGDVQLVVHGVTDPLVASNDVVVPAAGMRWVAVDAEVRNIADEPVAISSLAQFEVQDATNAAYDVTVTGENLPSIDGESPPGGGRRGTMVFEVPEAATGLRLVFTGDLLASGSAVVALG
jgi:hypothetical protein